jgi:phage head maturation protease
VNIKALRQVEVKTGDRGEVRAVISRFNAIDSDGDVTLPGAFEDGAEVVISAYGHSSWGGALPVGKGIIRSDGESARVEAEFFLLTSHGRDTFETIKQLGPLQQWSYGYEAIDAEPGTFKGRQMRFLKRLAVAEVSPVLVGAGVNTRTESAKDAAAREYARFVAAQLDLDDPAEQAAREYVRFVRASMEAAS